MLAVSNAQTAMLNAQLIQFVIQQGAQSQSPAATGSGAGRALGHGQPQQLPACQRGMTYLSSAQPSNQDPSMSWTAAPEECPQAAVPLSKACRQTGHAQHRGQEICAGCPPRVVLVRDKPRTSEHDFFWLAKELGFQPFLEAVVLAILGSAACPHGEGTALPCTMHSIQQDKTDSQACVIGVAVGLEPHGLSCQRGGLKVWPFDDKRRKWEEDKQFLRHKLASVCRAGW